MILDYKECYSGLLGTRQKIKQDLEEGICWKAFILILFDIHLTYFVSNAHITCLFFQLVFITHIAIMTILQTLLGSRESCELPRSSG